MLVDFKGGATFAGMAEMPHVSAVITNLGQELTLVDRMQDALSGRDDATPGAAARGRQLRDRSATTRRPAPPASRPRAAAVAVHRRRRVLRDAVRQAGVHRPVRRHRPARPVPGASTCCSPRSASRRVACAASSRTCPTGSACAPSRPASPAPSSGSPTPTSCRPSPGSATSSPTSRRCCGSRRRTSPVRRRPRPRCARDEGGAVRGDPAVHASPRCRRWRTSRPTPRGRRRPRPRAGRAAVAARHRRRPDERPRTRRPTRCGCRRSTSPTPSTSSCPTSSRTPSWA